MMHSAKSSLRLKAEPTPTYAWQFDAIGTQWSIEFFEPISLAHYKEICAAISRRIELFDATYSRFRADSLVSQMAQKAGMYTLPADGQLLLDMYQELYKHTNGQMTPLVGQLLSDAGYDAQYSLRPGQMTPPPTWEAVLDYHFPTLHVKKPTLLDFGAAGKGYLVDIIAGILTENRVKYFCVNAGGDMVCSLRPTNRLRVGLEHPGDSNQVIGVVSLSSDMALCGSAGNRRKWADFHHIIHPDSLRSPTHLRAVWVTADNALLADALTTALFFTSAKVLQTAYTFEYAEVLEDWSLRRSPNFPATFFNEEARHESTASS